MTPNPIRIHSAILTLNLTCNPRRKKTGNAAQIRSVIIERTIESQLDVLSSQGQRRRTTLGNHDVLENIVAQADRIDTNIPVRFQRPADTQENTHEDGGEYDQGTDDHMHCCANLFGVDDAQKEQTDADLSEHQRNERLNPISPAEGSKKASL